MVARPSSRRRCVKSSTHSPPRALSTTNDSTSSPRPSPLGGLLGGQVFLRRRHHVALAAQLVEARHPPVGCADLLQSPHNRYRRISADPGPWACGSWAPPCLLPMLPPRLTPAYSSPPSPPRWPFSGSTHGLGIARNCSHLGGLGCLSAFEGQSARYGTAQAKGQQAQSSPQV